MPLETQQQTYQQKPCQTALINQMGNANLGPGPLTQWKNLRFKPGDRQSAGNIWIFLDTAFDWE